MRLEGAQISRFFRELPTRLHEEMVAAESETLKDGRQSAVTASSGTLSKSALARMDHPYATRHRAPLLDPTLLNVGSGDVRDNWEIVGPVTVGDITLSRVVNLSDHAGFLKGTPKMVKRDIARRVALGLAQPRRNRLKEAVRATFQRPA